LFVFCLAIVAFNILSTVKAALKSVHGVGKIEAGLSDYYLVEEVQSTYRGMAIAKDALANPLGLAVLKDTASHKGIALPTSFWLSYLQMSNFRAQTLEQWAALVNLKRFSSFPRGQKKPKPKPIYDPKRPHVSTFRLLQ
jgi:hypothetical protein